MENEEIMIIDDGSDSPISPMGMCCAVGFICRIGSYLTCRIFLTKGGYFFPLFLSHASIQIPETISLP